MKKNEKGFSIVEVLIVLVIIGLIGVMGWLFLSRQKSTSTTTQTATDAKKESPNLQPEDVITKVKSNLESSYTVVSDSDGKAGKIPSGSVYPQQIQPYAPLYKPDGYNFYTSYDGGSWFDMYVNEKDAPAIVAAIAGTYQELGLKKMESKAPSGGSTGPGYDLYTGNGLVCAVVPADYQGSFMSTACGKIDNYKPAAEQAKPFADAMPDTDYSKIVMDLKISSPQNGYQTATANVGAARGLFYKKGSEPWQFFRGSQSILSCSDYNTADLKNAFRGGACIDASNKESTVQ